MAGLVAMFKVFPTHATANPAMRGLADVRTTLQICNAVPTADLLTVKITDSAAKVTTVDSVGFRECKTSAAITVRPPTSGSASLTYEVLLGDTRISDSPADVTVGTIAEQNILVIAPTATTRGTNAFKPELLASGQGDGSFQLTSGSYCIGGEAMVKSVINEVSVYQRVVDFAYPGWANPATYSPRVLISDRPAVYSFAPSQGLMYRAELTKESVALLQGKATFVAFTGISNSTGEFAPAVTVFGTNPGKSSLPLKSTTVQVCNAVPISEVLSVRLTDSASTSVMVEAIPFRGCKTTPAIMVAEQTDIFADTKLFYDVLLDDTRISTLTPQVKMGTLASQNIVVIAPTTATATAGSDAYQPQLVPTKMDAPGGYTLTSASFCVNMESEYAFSGSDIQPVSETLNYADSTKPLTRSYSTQGMPTELTADYRYTPSQGKAYSGKLSGREQAGEAAFVTCTGIKDDTGVFAPNVTVFGVPPAATSTGSAAGLGGQLSGWMIVALTAMTLLLERQLRA